MSLFVVSYDLNAPGRNYEALYEHLKGYGTWARPVESVWIVKSTSKTAGQIRDDAKRHMDSNDKLVVFETGTQWATQNVAASTNEWLHKHV